MLLDARTREWISGLNGAQPFAGWSVVFSSDGAKVSTSAGGAVHTWSLDASSWTEAACRMASRELTEQEWHSYLPERDYVAACDADV